MALGTTLPVPRLSAVRACGLVDFSVTPLNVTFVNGWLENFG